MGDSARGGPDAVPQFLEQARPLSTHRVLRPFLEAYRVVADVLVRTPPEDELAEAAWLERCPALGTQYALQQHVNRRESASKALLSTALKLDR